MTLSRAGCLAAGFLAAFPVCAMAEEIDATALYELPAADVIVLGEVHDNPVHHAHQAIAIGAIRPTAVIYEMLTEEQAARIRPEHYGSEAVLAAMLGWAGSGWPDFAMYYPGFVAGREALVIGGALDRAVVRRSMAEGAAAVFGDGAELFGLQSALDPIEQARRVEGQAAAHCGALPTEMLPGMVEAQRLRDAVLARAVLTALEAVGAPVVVIAGNGHARRDWGVPFALAGILPDITILSVGQYEGEAEETPPYDLWLVTEAVARDDPCLEFNKR